MALTRRLPDCFRATSDAVGTSNVAAATLPFQRWYNFKEAFTPSFVEEVIASHPGRVESCLDPFGGCGTTALTCQFLGVRPTTIEVNPFLADLIETKLTIYDEDALVQDWTALQARCAVAEVIGEGEGYTFPGAPATFVEPGVGGRWIFDAAVAARIGTYLREIEAVEVESHRRLFRVLLGSVLIEASNVTISGKGRRYRSNWQARRRGVGDLSIALGAAFGDALYDLCRYGARREASYRLLHGDSRVRITEAEPVDLVLFSPPYPNSFDYTDIYNVELWTLGYLKSGSDNQTLRESTLRSHVQIRRSFTSSDLGSAALAETLERLDAAQADLWNRHIPGMVASYFEDLVTILRGARDRLTPGGQIVMVVGDSRYAGVLVDVPLIVRELVPGLGLRCEEVREVRSMRSSPQHGGALTLGESLLRLALA